MSRSVAQWFRSVRAALRGPRLDRGVGTRSAAAALCVESLESRDLLTVTAALVGTALTIATDANSTLTVAAAAGVLNLTAGTGPIASTGITDDDGSGADATAKYDLTLIDSITIVNSGGGVFTTLTFNATNVGGDTITATANQITVAGAVVSGNAALTAATGNLTINGQFDTTGGVGTSNLFLTAANGDIGQTAKVVATNLFATAKQVTLSNAGNLVATIAGSSTNGNFSLTSDANLTVGTVNGADGIDAEVGNITLTTTTGLPLTINKHLEADDLKTISLTAGTINQAAAGTILAESGKLNQVALTADRITLAGTDTVAASDIFITTQATNRDIELGTADSGTVLGLDDTDFNAINATTLTITAKGTGNLTVAGNVDAAGDATNLLLTTSNSAGLVTVNKSLTATDLRIVADDVTIDTTNGAIAAGQLEFRTFTAATGIALGAGGTDYLSNAELQRITLSGATTGGLNVLSFATANGGIQILEALDLTGKAETLSLSAEDGITQSNGSTITVANLQASAASVTLWEANAVSKIAGNAGTSFAFRSTLNLTVDRVAGTDAFSTADTVAGVTAVNTVLLETAADKSITQSATSGDGKIAATDFGVRAGTGIDLADAANAVTGTFAAQLTTSGDIRFNNTDATGLILGSVAGAGDIANIDGVTSAVGTSNVTIVNSGILSIENVIRSDEAVDERLATVRLQATGGDITQTAAGIIQADALGARAKANIVLVDTTAHDIGEFAAITTEAGQVALFSDSPSLFAEAVTADGTLFAAVTGISSGAAATTVLLRNSGGITIGEAIASTEAGTPQLTAVYLNATAAGSAVTQAVAGTISADLLAVTAANAVLLNGANVVDEFTARTTTKFITFFNNDTADGTTLTIGSAATQTINGVEMYTASTGITSAAAANVTVITDENLTVSQDIERDANANLGIVSLTAGNAAADPTGTLSLGAEVRAATLNLTTTDADITQTAGFVNVGTLSATAGTGFKMEQGNDADILNLTLTSGDGSFVDTDDLALNTVTLGSVADPDTDLDIVVTGAVTLTGTFTQQVLSTAVLSDIGIMGATTVTSVAGNKFDMQLIDANDLFDPNAIAGGYVLLTSNVNVAGTPAFAVDGTSFNLGDFITIDGVTVTLLFDPTAGITLRVGSPPFNEAAFAGVQNVVFNVPAVVQEVPAVVYQTAPPVEQDDFGSGGSSLAESSFLVTMFGEGDGAEKFWVISSIDLKEGKEIVVPARLNGVELIEELRKAFGVKIAGQFGKYLIEIDDVTSAKDEQGKKLKSVRVRFSFNAETQDELLKRLQDIGDDKKKLFEFLQTLPEAQVLPESTSKPAGTSPDGEGAGLHPAAAGFLAGVWGSFRDGASTVYAAATGDHPRGVSDASPQHGPRLGLSGGREQVFEQETALEATSSTQLGAAALGAVSALARRRSARDGSGFERDLDGFMEAFDAADSRR